MHVSVQKAIFVTHIHCIIVALNDKITELIYKLTSLMSYQPRPSIFILLLIIKNN